LQLGSQPHRVASARHRRQRTAIATSRPIAQGPRRPLQWGLAVRLLISYQQRLGATQDSHQVLGLPEGFFVAFAGRAPERLGRVPRAHARPVAPLRPQDAL